MGEGGHVGRAHANSLKELAKKEFSSDIKTKYTNKFLQVMSAKCQHTRHRAGCGCMSDSFIKGARINHFRCLQQCQNPTEYFTGLRNLSNDHVRDINALEDGNFDLHPSKMCRSNICDGDEDRNHTSTTGLQMYWSVKNRQTQ